MKEEKMNKIGIYRKITNLLKVSQEFNLNSNPNSCFEHLFIISNKSRVSEFGAGYENRVKPTDFGFSSNSNGFFNKKNIIDNAPIFCDIIRSLNSSFFLASESRCNSCNFDDSNRREIHQILPVFNFFSYGLNNNMQPELLFINRIFLLSSWRDNGFCKNSGVKSEIHRLYSLSRISRINLVESMSDMRSFSISLFNSDNDNFLCFLNLSSAIKECNSISTFINFLTTNDSSIDFTQDEHIYKVFYNSPAPFVLSNDGNAELNISINASDLCSSVVNPTSNYQYQIRNTSAGCFILSGTQTSWANVPNATTLTNAINRFNFTSGYQTGCSNTSVDILVSVPSTEPSGNKSSAITFISSLAEPKVS